MEFIEDLRSNSSPKRKKAAKAIGKSKRTGYGQDLLNALEEELPKKRAWATQVELIYAIALTDYKAALPRLKELLNEEFESTIIYIRIGFAIALLEPMSNENAHSLFKNYGKREETLSGLAMGLLFKQIKPSEKDISKLIKLTEKITKDEGRIITPRCYLAASAHNWPKTPKIKTFLESCKQSVWPILRDIAQSSLENKNYKWKPW